MIDLRDFVSEVVRTVERREIAAAPGCYARSLPAPDGGAGGARVDPYGCAGALNLLYTVRHLPPPAKRPQMIEGLRALQDPATGLFRDPTHDPLHTTAHCIAALELLEARPAHELHALAGWSSPDAVAPFLDALDWTWNPWRESHRGAGLYAALALTGGASREWEARYFAWLWEETDPDTGLWRRGRIAEGGDPMLFHHLAGSFHYLFNHEHARRPLRFADRMVDSCLRIAREELFPPLARTVGFAELDWVYCLSRALHQSAHRHAEARAALGELGERYADFLLSLDPRSDPGLNDLHQLLGAVSAFAELQRAIPGLVRTEHPLRLVLDRRPFV